MAMIADAFVGKLVERLAAFVEEKVILVLGVKDELQRLQRRLSRIRSVLKDAERRRIEDEAVNHWLNELKGVMYDADDILDLCSLEGGKLLDDHQSSKSSSSSSSPLVRCYSPLLSCFTSVPLRHEIGQSIQNLNNKLEEISNDKLRLSLEPARPDDNRLGGVNPRQTSPLVEYSAVGRDIKDATNKLVEWIVGEEKQKCRVFAIVGMGGIGKTTLAQNLFNEPRIKKSFQQLVWVCVSQSFSETNLLKQIIRSAGGDKHEDAQTKTELLPMLMEVVIGKGLFLVLDDVWGADVWVDLLRIPLQAGAANCSIIVTTRSEIVANMMKPVCVHRVEELSVEFGWELLCKIVFRDDEEEEIQCFRDVGIQIVNKCHGLPLAIKTIAGVLSAKKRTRGEWEKVARSKAWSMSQLPKDLSGALYLSYEDLPSHLKQCFLYLSLFPEGYKYEMADIIPLWIAGGFVETNDENLLEDTAEEYYKELIQRSLLHPHPEYFDEEVCTMHDLLRSLACFLSRNECFYGDVEGIPTSVTSQLRHLSIADRGERTLLLTNSMIRPEHLRTLLLLQSSSTIIDNDLISRLRLLRVLVIHEKRINCIPNSIGDLIHMRLLELNDTSVSDLPESIGRLTNLQILRLQSCISLHALPKSITQLDNLRLLDLDGTPVNHMPKGIGKLKQLTYLDGFVLGDDSIAGNPHQGCDLEELQYLSQLRHLCIERLERASTGISALQSKSHLKELFLYCSHHTDGGGQQSYTDEERGKIEATFNELIPPPCLQTLVVSHFFGRSYPRWLSTSLLRTCLPDLTYIRLKKCISCPRVPPLGELSQLKTLIISGASAVLSIGPEFIGADVREGIQDSTSTAFPKLEYLQFKRMTNWKEWSFGGEAEERAAGESRIENRSVVFPCLRDLKVYRCPNLRTLPKGLEQATALHQLRLSSNNSLESVPSLLALKILYIHNCPALKRVGSLNVLTELSLRDTNMDCLPQWLIQLLQQRLQAEDNYFELDLCCNVKLLHRCLKDGPGWSIIRQFPKVDAHTKDRSAYLYYTKEPFSYRANLPGSQDPKV